ncbi:hypothetical protein PE36_07317 [Moritella sp. PE36]|uniref:hypothetical protein n=1 Tax=Moritella sp. PE36 TaxID=58051 RepID=UPI00015689BF|nr:hypothetical protein [Moritella sp. PE36]EDM69278.1 hypothetical protein PE36_07317 [Moritella sp. PE36]
MIFPSSPSTTASESGIAINSAGTNSPINVSFQKALGSLPSILNPLLDEIIAVYEPQYEEVEGVFIDPDIDIKINYNSVRVYAEEIRDQSGYMSLIEEILDCIDNETPKAKNKFLWAINKKYKDCKKKLFIEMNIDTSDKAAVREAICANADKIITDVSKDIIKHSVGHINSTIELIEAAQELIVCYGFINCQILEKPE